MYKAFDHCSFLIELEWLILKVLLQQAILSLGNESHEFDELKQEENLLLFMLSNNPDKL